MAPVLQLPFLDGDPVIPEKHALLRTLGLPQSWSLGPTADPTSQELGDAGSLVDSLRVAFLHPDELDFLHEDEGHRTISSADRGTSAAAGQGTSAEVGQGTSAAAGDGTSAAAGEAGGAPDPAEAPAPAKLDRQGRWQHFAPWNRRKALFAARQICIKHGLSDMLRQVDAEIAEFCSAANKVSPGVVNADIQGAGLTLEKYCVRSGVALGPVFVGQHSDSDRGFYASDDMNPGSPIVSVPPAVLVTCRRALLDPGFAGVAEKLIDDGEGVLQLYLIFCRARQRQGVQLSLDLDFLLSTSPDSYTCLITWPAPAVAALGQPHVAQVVATKHAELEALGARARAAGWPGDLPLAHEDLVWAKAFTDSRAFSVEVPVEAELQGRGLPERVLCVVPVADMMNHAMEAQCTIPTFNREQNCFQLVTQAAIPKGAQVYLNYGTLQTWELLCYYGFCPHNNICDTLTFDITPEDPAKLVELTASGLPTEHSLRRGGPGDGLPPRLLPAVQICVEGQGIDAISVLSSVVQSLLPEPLDPSVMTETWWHGPMGRLVREFRDSQCTLVARSLDRLSKLSTEPEAKRRKLSVATEPAGS